MWYKRYGYRHPSGGGIGCIGAALPVLISLPIAVALVVLFRSGWPLLLVIPVSFLGFWIAEDRASHEGADIRQHRRQHHIDRARQQIAQGRNWRALESIRRARIYGPLPSDLAEFDKSRRRRRRNQVG